MVETIDYIGEDDLIFTNDLKEGIHSGGFNVKSLMMKAGMSPIMTLNKQDQLVGGSNKVSDLFENLVIPNWALTYHDRMVGGEYKDHDSDDDSDIEDDIHDKLINLARQDEKSLKNIKNNNKKHKLTKKNNIHEKSNKKSKTKKHK